MIPFPISIFLVADVPAKITFVSIHNVVYNSNHVTISTPIIHVVIVLFFVIITVRSISARRTGSPSIFAIPVLYATVVGRDSVAHAPAELGCGLRLIVSILVFDESGKLTGSLVSVVVSRMSGRMVV